VLPQPFTLSALQRAFDALPETLLARKSFRRRMEESGPLEVVGEGPHAQRLPPADRAVPRQPSARISDAGCWPAKTLGFSQRSTLLVSALGPTSLSRPSATARR